MSQSFAAEDLVVIFGAGPAGLTAAYELTKIGMRPLVVEKHSRVGGLARTENFKGFHFDIGGHRFFTKVEDVRKMWREILPNDFLRRPRLSRIYYQGKFFDYPLKPWNALGGLGVWQSLLIGLSYLRWQLFPYRREDTFEQWVTNRFGRRLFLTFFKTYTEKVWGISCSELKAEWAAQRIKDLSLKTALVSMFVKPKNTIKTLIGEFDYPRLGPGMMWSAVQREIERRGGIIRLETEVLRIDRAGSRVVSALIGSKGREEIVHGMSFVSSMPLRDFIERLDPPPPLDVRSAAKKLTYRDFLTVCLIVNKPELFADNWIYVHDPEVAVGRIQNFKNWSPDMVSDPSKTSLGLEYFCAEGDALWNLADQELIEKAKREVDRLGLASYADVEDGSVVRVAKAYPVYDSDYRDYLATVRGYVDSLENFQTIGRNGLHRYNNQDHAMVTGMLAVENIRNGRKHDLWAVNVDQDYHEEVRVPAGVDPAQVESVVQAALGQVFAKLDRVALGVSVGTAAGLLLFLATWVGAVKGGAEGGFGLHLLGQYFPGYEVTPLGSPIGLAYGFVSGFLGGWTFAFLRNAAMFFYIAGLKRRAERRLLRRVLDYI